MRRMLAILFVAPALVAAAVPAHAQWSNPAKEWSLRAFGGFSLPLGSTANTIDTGWDAGLGAQYHPDDRPLGVYADVTFHRWQINQKLLEQWTVPDGNAWVWAVSLNADYSPTRKGTFGYFVYGGPTLNFDFAEATEPATSDGIVCSPWWGCWPVVADQVIGRHTSVSFGLNAGAALTVKTGSPAEVYLEGRYHYQFLKDGHDAQYLPLGIGVRW
ncbi:MAG: outer membrane beta-barrel protein [Candidatus Eisenbacteria bacterium]